MGREALRVSADMPIFPMGIACGILKVHPNTLRLYERERLLEPARRGGKRYYSERELEWLRCLREMLHEKGFSLQELRRSLTSHHCWELKPCDKEQRANCQGHVIPELILTSGKQMG